MKTKAQVTADLLQGCSGQKPGQYVNVLAEDLLIALQPEPAPPTPTPPQPNDDTDPIS